MHYIGMAALMLEGSILWDRRIVGVSVMIAVVASGVALWLAFRLRDKHKGVFVTRILAALVMSAAISAMHYTGMSAAHFHEMAHTLPAGQRAGVIHLGFRHHARPARHDVNYFAYRFALADQPADGQSAPTQPSA